VEHAASATLGACAWALLSAGCATTGFGVGELEANRSPTTGPLRAAEFRWHSAAPEAATGRIEVALPDGRRFDGDYTREGTALGFAVVDLGDGTPGCEPVTCVEVPKGSDAPYSRASLRLPSSHVDAHLRDRMGTEMTCAFVLDHPMAGLAGGGNGQCSLSDGERVERANLPGA
jgi:hypothetical protein